VNVDLGGQTLSGSIVANLGDGANQLSIVNGTLSGRLIVAAGNGADQVTLGDGSSALSLKDVYLLLYGGIDTVTAQSGVNISRSLITTYANNITLDEGSSVNNAFIRGGTSGNTLDVAGTVTGDLIIDSSYWFGSAAGTSVNVTGEVDGSLYFAGSNQ